MIEGLSKEERDELRSVYEAELQNDALVGRILAEQMIQTLDECDALERERDEARISAEASDGLWCEEVFAHSESRQCEQEALDTIDKLRAEKPLRTRT